MLASEPSTSPTPEASPSPPAADSPNPLLLSVPLKSNHHRYHLTLIPGIGIAVTAVAVMMLIVLIFLIRKKSSELEGPDQLSKSSSKSLPPCATWRYQDGMPLASILLNIFLKDSICVADF